MPVWVFAQTPPWIQAGFQAGLHDYFIRLQKKPEFHKFDIHITERLCFVSTACPRKNTHNFDLENIYTVASAFDRKGYKISQQKKLEFQKFDILYNRKALSNKYSLSQRIDNRGQFGLDIHYTVLLDIHPCYVQCRPNTHIEGVYGDALSALSSCRVG